MNDLSARLLALLLLSVVSVRAQDCTQATTCGECYAIEGCSWCLMAEFTGARCYNEELDNVACNEVENIPSTFSEDPLELTEDNQISLRRADVSLRMGVTQRLNVSVRPAENFPLDLYMLIDQSNSLATTLETIKSSAGTIAETINSISSRFQVGLGTFVDKLATPYVSRLQQDLAANSARTSACSDDDSVCIRPFSYVHNVNLTNSAANFSSLVEDLVISTNADEPEGTLDAILQAVVCREIVGWRENARKILLIITDDVLHSAGDGRIAGIIRPSVSECFTRYDPDTGHYTYVDNTVYDYPSIEQIRQVLQENIVSAVFAIREAEISQVDYYRNVAPLLDQGAEVVTLTQNSDNIISAIETAYNNLVSRVALSYTAPEGITITHTPNCPESTIEESLSCINVSTNQTITFDIDVTLDDCNEFLRNNPNQEITVNIRSYGRFVIGVEALCNCECEGSANTNSSECNFQGDLVCGVCECNDQWTGDACTCFLDTIDADVCPSGPNGEECSSRGTCECGTCQCDTPANTRTDEDGQTLYTVTEFGSTYILEDLGMRFGNACECDNFRCPRNADDFVCSLNGECFCEEGTGALRCQCGLSDFGGFQYQGDSCQCNEAFCYDQTIPFSSNRTACNGNGECDNCNRNNPCTCNDGFITQFCISAESLQGDCFPGGSSEEGCIECIANEENWRANCNGRCGISFLRYNFERMDNAPPNRDEFVIVEALSGSTQSCDFVEPDPFCQHYYYVARNRTDNERSIIYVEPRSSSCLSLPWYAIGLIILASLIILGIVVIIVIKLIFLCLDYKELKKFQKEVAEADLSKNFNPLYQSPNVNYTNVAFGKE